MNSLYGKKFGRLVALKPNGRSKNRFIIWRCLCSCGQKVNVISSNLRNGNTKSCGCVQKEKAKKRLFRKPGLTRTHGMSGSTTYKTWVSMMQRCGNSNSIEFKNYGARGITVCKRWNKFQNFLQDMGAKPSGLHQLDRINNSMGYSLSNCRWATPIENSNNKRNNVRLTFNSKNQTVAQWSRETGIPYNRLNNRIKRGWTVKRALETA